MTSSSRDRYADLGLLIMRVGVGSAFIWYLGSAKFAGGPQVLTDTGKAVSHFGLNSGFYWWGLLAASAETLGGLCLILGLLFRPATLAMFATMIVATVEQYTRPMPVPVHSIVDAFVFLGLFIIGPGSYSLDRLLFARSRERTAGSQVT